LVIGLWEMKLNATEIAEAVGISEPTARGSVNLWMVGFMKATILLRHGIWRV
jgi:hypothetical protein